MSLAGDVLTTTAGLAVSVWAAVTFCGLYGDLSRRLEAARRTTRPLLPVMAGLTGVGCALSGRGTHGALGVVATLVLWIVGGGGGGMRHLLELGQQVARRGNRLVVEDS